MAKLEALAELLLGKNPQGAYKFRKIPRNALPSLPHSNAALVRANEVLDGLSIPIYGC